MMTAVQHLACIYVHAPCCELFQINIGDGTQCLIAAKCRRPCPHLRFGPPGLDHLEPILGEMPAQFNGLEIANSTKVGHIDLDLATGFTVCYTQNRAADETATLANPIRSRAQAHHRYQILRYGGLARRPDSRSILSSYKAGKAL